MTNKLDSFKTFLEDKTRSLKKPDGKPEDYLDGLDRELGIDPSVSIPQYVESGPVHFEDEGLWFNQAVWEVLKPVEKNDMFVRVRLVKFTSPNLNQRVYRRREDGQMEPYTGPLSTTVHLIKKEKLAEMMGRGWQTAAPPPM